MMIATYAQIASERFAGSAITYCLSINDAWVRPVEHGRQSITQKVGMLQNSVSTWSDGRSRDGAELAPARPDAHRCDFSIALRAVEGAKPTPVPSLAARDAKVRAWSRSTDT